MNEEKKVKRKLKWQIKFILLIVIIVLYPFFIGTKGIFIKEYKLTTSKINQNTHGLKILQFSDLNYKSNLSDTKFNNLIRKINETKPDIVIFTGDLIDKNYDVKDEDITKLKTNLKKIKAEFGKYYVPGEQDGEREVEILNSSEFINLDDKVQYVYPKSNIPIVFLSKETCNSFFSENKNEIPYNLLILHNPDDIKDFKEWQGGDIIVFKNHIGIISDKRNKNGIPFIIHHASPVQRAYEEDILEVKTDIIGHYRY